MAHHHLAVISLRLAAAGWCHTEPWSTSCSQLGAIALPGSLLLLKVLFSQEKHNCSLPSGKATLKIHRLYWLSNRSDFRLKVKITSHPDYLSTKSAKYQRRIIWAAWKATLLNPSSSSPWSLESHRWPSSYVGSQFDLPVRSQTRLFTLALLLKVSSQVSQLRLSCSGPPPFPPCSERCDLQGCFGGQCSHSTCNA